MTTEGADQRPDPGEAQRAEQRRRATVILCAVVAIAVVAAVVAGIALTQKSTPKAPTASVADSSHPSGSGAPNPVSTPAAAGVVRALTTVSPAVEAQVGKGESAVAMKPINGPQLRTRGEPTMLYVGGLFCPYCAAERWAVIQALSRFGTFSGLAEIRSSEDGFATFDFEKSRYASKFLAFKPVELEGQNQRPLQKLTTTQVGIFSKFGKNSFPFLYLDGKYAQQGAGYNPAILEGLDHEQIASQLRDPASPITTSIIGEANVLTAAICGITGNQPSTVCSVRNDVTA